jgi:K+ transporter
LEAFCFVSLVLKRSLQILAPSVVERCRLVAHISEHPDAFSNPFYNSVPKGWLIPSLIVALGAAIVASQAMITATFQVRLSSISQMTLLTISSY